MICKACNKSSSSKEPEDCFEIALDAIKHHYIYYKNALEQRDLELKQVKERNDKLNKALQLLQKDQQPHKRFNSQHSSESWIRNTSDDRLTSDISISSADDEPIAACNHNMAINSEQLFDTSSLSPAKNDVSITTSSENVISPRPIESSKRNKQHEMMRCLKDRNKGTLNKTKTEWHTKERNSPVEKSWANKFVKPSTTTKTAESKNVNDLKKADKRLCLSLKKQNPSKMKQSLIQFNKSKDDSVLESDVCEDIIDASPVVLNKNSRAGRSWSHRSGQNISSSNNISNNENAQQKKGDADETIDDIVFDFSPTKKTQSSMDISSPIKSQPKVLKFDNDISSDCTSLPQDHLGITANKSDSSNSVLILTPNTQDIIFVDDTCNDVADIDTMQLLADIMKHDNTDNLETLKKIESKNIQQQQKQDLQQFKKPQIKLQANNLIKPSTSIKQEKITQVIEDVTKSKEIPVTSSSTTNTTNSTKPQNPLFSTTELDEEEEDDSMPQPFLVKKEPEVASSSKKPISFKERFNIDCAFCENFIKICGDTLTNQKIQEHLDKCTRHNNQDVLRQNTPKDFWNPFILSFQEDDPRNEVLIDTRFKDKKPN